MMEINRLIRSKRRSISLEITQQGELVVRAPRSMPNRDIEELVRQHEGWIHKKRKEIEAKPKSRPHTFQTGELFYFLGESYRLHVTDSRSFIRIEDGCFLLPFAATNQDMGKAITGWYQKKAKEILLPRVRELADQYGFHYTNAKITSAKTRWGSCSANNSICLSWYLIMAPRKVADCVILHELCHTIHHNHSKSFWSLVEDLMPDYPVYRQWLKQNRSLMGLEIADDR